MDGFDILILVLGIVTGVILFALGLPFYLIVIYFVAIMFLVGMPIAIIFGIAKWITMVMKRGKYYEWLCTYEFGCKRNSMLLLS